MERDQLALDDVHNDPKRIFRNQENYNRAVVEIGIMAMLSARR